MDLAITNQVYHWERLYELTVAYLNPPALLENVFAAWLLPINQQSDV